MAARQGQGEVHFLAHDIARYPRRAVGVKPGEPDVRPLVLTETQDIGDAPGPGLVAQKRVIRIVGVEDGNARRVETVEDLGLGQRDVLHRVEELEMDRVHGGDDGDVGPDQAGQRGDLAGMVHGHLEHAKFGIGGHAGDRKRHAPAIVEVAQAGADRAKRRQGCGHGFLGAGLADAAGDGDDPGRGPLARGPGQFP